MASSSTSSASLLKLRGTAAYKSRDYIGARDAYSEALSALRDDESERAELEPVLLANIGQCAIMLHDWEVAVESCTKCLAVRPGHIKARYRRACALEKLRRQCHSYMHVGDSMCAREGALLKL